MCPPQLGGLVMYVRLPQNWFFIFHARHKETGAGWLLASADLRREKSQYWAENILISDAMHDVYIYIKTFILFSLNDGTCRNLRFFLIK